MNKKRNQIKYRIKIEFQLKKQQKKEKEKRKKRNNHIQATLVVSQVIKYGKYTKKGKDLYQQFNTPNLRYLPIKAMKSPVHPNYSPYINQ